MSNVKLRRWLLFVAIFLFWEATPAQITFVQGKSFFNGSSQTSPINVTFDSNVTAGNLLIASIYTPHTTDVYNTPTGNSNTFEVGQGACIRSGQANGNGSIKTWYVKSATAGATTIQFSWTGGASSWTIAWIQEDSGHNATASSDVTSCNNGSGSTSVDSGSAATSENNELIYGWGDAFDGFTAVGSGFTERYRANGALAEDRILATAGSTSATATQGGTDGWIFHMVTFKPAAAATGLAKLGGTAKIGGTAIIK